MVDNGAGGDAVTGDDIYSVVLPAQGNRVLVRYRIIVTDALGVSRRAPFEDDPSLNFACFVYDGVPDYLGFSSETLQTLPVFTLISRAQDIDECLAYNGTYQIPQFLDSYANPGRFVFNWPGTLVHEGEVYDNMGGEQNYADEFIELQDVTHTNVPLYSLEFPTNTWRLRDAVTFNFPPNVTLAVGGRLLVVSFDPAGDPVALASFRARYGLGPNVVLVGPWSGRLDNSGETIELLAPDMPAPDGFVPYLMVEKVAYRPAAPWPEGAKGTGASLQRATLLDYANDPLNWFVATATPGTLSPTTSADVDGDGMPDVWEMLNGTDVFTPDGDGDLDGDGFSNHAE